MSNGTANNMFDHLYSHYATPTFTDARTIATLVWLLLTTPLYLLSFILLIYHRHHHPIVGRGRAFLIFQAGMFVVGNILLSMAQLYYPDGVPCGLQFVLIFLVTCPHVVAYLLRGWILLFRLEIRNYLIELQLTEAEEEQRAKEDEENEANEALTKRQRNSNANRFQPSQPHSPNPRTIFVEPGNSSTNLPLSNARSARSMASTGKKSKTRPTRHRPNRYPSSVTATSAGTRFDRMQGYWYFINRRYWETKFLAATAVISIILLVAGLSPFIRYDPDISWSNSQYHREHRLPDNVDYTESQFNPDTFFHSPPCLIYSIKIFLFKIMLVFVVLPVLFTLSWKIRTNQQRSKVLQQQLEGDPPKPVGIIDEHQQMMRLLTSPTVQYEAQASQLQYRPQQHTHQRRQSLPMLDAPPHSHSDLPPPPPQRRSLSLLPVCDVTHLYSQPSSSPTAISPSPFAPSSSPSISPHPMPRTFTPTPTSFLWPPTPEPTESTKTRNKKVTSSSKAEAARVRKTDSEIVQEELVIVFIVSLIAIPFYSLLDWYANSWIESTELIAFLPIWYISLARPLWICRQIPKRHRDFLSANREILTNLEASMKTVNTSKSSRQSQQQEPQRSTDSLAPPFTLKHHLPYYDLDFILTNPHAFTIFLAFLQKEYSIENALFCKEVNQFHQSAAALEKLIPRWQQKSETTEAQLLSPSTQPLSQSVSLPLCSPPTSRPASHRSPATNRVASSPLSDHASPLPPFLESPPGRESSQRLNARRGPSPHDTALQPLPTFVPIMPEDDHSVETKVDLVPLTDHLVPTKEDRTHSLLVEAGLFHSDDEPMHQPSVDDLFTPPVRASHLASLLSPARMQPSSSQQIVLPFASAIEPRHTQMLRQITLRYDAAEPKFSPTGINTSHAVLTTIERTVHPSSNHTNQSSTILMSRQSSGLHAPRPRSTLSFTVVSRTPLQPTKRLLDSPPRSMASPPILPIESQPKSMVDPSYDLRSLHMEASRLKAWCLQLVELYLRPNSPLQVNLPKELSAFTLNQVGLLASYEPTPFDPRTNQAMDALRATTFPQPPPVPLSSMFDRPAAIIFELIRRESFRRFVTTAQFRQLLARADEAQSALEERSNDLQEKHSHHHYRSETQFPVHSAPSNQARRSAHISLTLGQAHDLQPTPVSFLPSPRSVLSQSHQANENSIPMQAPLPSHSNFNETSAQQHILDHYQRETLTSDSTLA